MGECDETPPPTPAVPIAQPVPCVPLGIAIHPYFYFHGMMPLPVLSPTPTLTGAATLAVHPFAAPIFAATPGATPAIAADAVGAAASAAPITYSWISAGRWHTSPAPFGRTMPTPSAGVTRPSPPVLFRR